MASGPSSTVPMVVMYSIRGCIRLTVLRLIMLISLYSRYSWISSNMARCGFRPSSRLLSVLRALMRPPVWSKYMPSLRGLKCGARAGLFIIWPRASSNTMLAWSLELASRYTSGPFSPSLQDAYVALPATMVLLPLPVPTIMSPSRKRLSPVFLSTQPYRLHSTKHCHGMSCMLS